MFCKSKSKNICFCGAHCSCIECDRNINGELMNTITGRYNVANFAESCSRYNYEFPKRVEDIGIGDLFYTIDGLLLRATKIGEDYILGTRISHGNEIKCQKDEIDLGRVRRAYV